MRTYGAFYSLFGETRAGLLDGPFWCFEVAEVEDLVTIETFKREKEEKRQREIVAKMQGEA